MLTQGSELLAKTVQASFWNTFNFNYSDPFAGLVDVRSSTQLTDTYAWLADPDMPEEWVGDSDFKSLLEYSLTGKNKFYRSSLVFSKEHRKFQQIDEMARAASRLAEKVRVHRTKLLSELVNNGVSDTCYDGQFFFDDDHADAGASYTTSQDNDLTSAITTVASPTDAEFGSALRGMFNALRGFLDNAGDPIMVGQEPQWIVMVPAGYAAIAHRVQMVDSLTGPVGNDLRGKFEVRVNQFLTAPSTTGAIYAFNQTWSRKPFMLQLAQDVALEQEEDTSKGSLAFHADWVGKELYGDWRAACSHIFTAA